MPAETTADPSPTVSELQRQVSELSDQLRAQREEHDEALQREAAIAEILRVINDPAADLERVFDVLVEKAAKLCTASYGYVWLYDGKQARAIAAFGEQQFKDWLRDRDPFVPAEASALGQAILQKRLVHVVDAAKHEGYRTFRNFREVIDKGGVRTLLHVPLCRGGDVLGVITVYRQERRPFSDRQIALLESFAAQAVIAMENARLLSELRQRSDDLTESLEYQTATSELLGVISCSPTDIQPVLNTMLASAARLCATHFGTVAIRQGDVFLRLAVLGYTPEVEQALRLQPVRPGRDSVSGRVLLEKQVVQIADLAADAEFSVPALVRFDDLRTTLGVPLLRDGEPIGVIAITRDRVEPFSERQIAQVKTFADQAVIAMENARLLIEQSEALEQQTATAEVLQVINSSPGNLVPVFAAILEKTMHICGAAFGGLWTLDGDRYVAAALHNVPKPFAEFLRESTTLPGPGTPPYRLLQGERSVIQNIDLAAEEPYHAGDPIRRALVDLGGARSALQVPLCKNDSLIGVVTIYRQEVRAFSEKQIALLQNFAAQAVIAMENARLLNELRERNEEIAGWNRDLETRVAEQVEELSRSDV